MIDLSSESARSWLARRMDARPEELRITPLGGGVSNHVLLVETPLLRCVVKQSLGKLRVEQDWYCSRDRIWRECDALRAMERVLPPGAVPQVVWEEQDDRVFAMEAAPREAGAWKTALLSGETDLAVAEEAGRLLARWIQATASPEWLARFGELRVFDDLRLDPYYRAASSRNPHFSWAFERAILRAEECRLALVHGDYSPKNLLVSPGRVMIIDWEVVHFGDPAFDAAFMTNHLLLKAIHRPERWREFRGCAEAFWQSLPEWHEGALIHLPCLLLARVDGKSPVEYLVLDTQKELVRQAAAQILKRPPQRAPDVFNGVFA